MPADPEVIVVGGGPAGAVAARTLAATGVHVLLIDRSPFPRNKPCGGGITTRVLRRFPWFERAISGIDVHRIAKLHLEGPGGARFDVQSKDPKVLLVRRVEFDHALINEARAAGATLDTSFEVTQVTSDDDGVTLQSRDGRRLRSPLVIAADGVHSVVAKRLGVNVKWPRTHLAIDMMEETPVATLAATDPAVLWVAYAHAGLDGYAYVFPKTHHVNVGIGCLLSHFDDEAPGRPYDLQTRFVSSLVDRGVLRGQSDRESFTPFLIPIGGPLPETHRGRVLFAGDAGGFVNAITAEGIYYAMVSGELAGCAVARMASSSRGRLAGSVYERAWQREIGTELRDAVRVQRYLFSAQDRIARAIRGARAKPELARTILDYVGGGLSYRGLRRKILFRFPLTALRLARQRLTGSVAPMSRQS